MHTSLRDKLVYAGRFSTNPVYSLFHCDGNWKLLASGSLDCVLAKYLEVLAKPEFSTEFRCDGVRMTGGMEFRCNGVRVDVSS